MDFAKTFSWRRGLSPGRYAHAPTSSTATLLEPPRQKGRIAPQRFLWFLRLNSTRKKTVAELLRWSTFPVRLLTAQRPNKPRQRPKLSHCECLPTNLSRARQPAIFQISRSPPREQMVQQQGETSPGGVAADWLGRSS